MELYSAPGSCAFCAHVVLEHLGLPHTVVFVDLREPLPALLAANPIGKVPTLRLSNGRVLSQSLMVLPYLARIEGRRALLPDGDAGEEVMQWLAFFNSDVHPALKMIAGAERYCNDPEGLKSAFHGIAERYFEIVDRRLAGSDWLVGKEMTLADIYAGAAWGWAGKFAPDLSRFENYRQMAEKFEALPAVRRVRDMESAAVLAA